MAPTHRAFTTNFFAELSPSFNSPLWQGMPGTTLGGAGTQDRRTNVVQRVFFLTQGNQEWNAIGYQVIPDYPNGGVGTLYRFYTNKGNIAATNMSGEFFNAPLARLNRISEGVVHFRLRAFATNGYPIIWDGFGTNAVFRTNVTNFGYSRLRNTFASRPLPAVPEQVNYYFTSNAVPAYLELEVGILEPHIFERYRAIGGGTNLPPVPLQQAQLRYLSNHVAQVHIFRRNIPIGMVDFSAYK